MNCGSVFPASTVRLLVCPVPLAVGHPLPPYDYPFARIGFAVGFPSSFGWEKTRRRGGRNHDLGLLAGSPVPVGFCGVDGWRFTK